MKHNKTYSPVVIIGMHRSGTTLVSKILESAGLFIGEKKDNNFESLFFSKLNNWLLRQCHCGWDNPKPILDLFNNEEATKIVIDYLDIVLKSPKIIPYLGLKKYLHVHSLRNITFPWGWKDPRNTFTIPIWAKIFPELKLIHVRRNGIDVANSLLVRRNKKFETELKKFQNQKIFYYFINRRKNFSHTLRCSTLEGGFSLWEEYMEQAEKICYQFPAEKVHQIEYEDFILNPDSYIKDLLTFCNLKHDSKEFGHLLNQINKNRAYALFEDNNLIEFTQKFSKRLMRHGYYIKQKQS